MQPNGIILRTFACSMAFALGLAGCDSSSPSKEKVVIREVVNTPETVADTEAPAPSENEESVSASESAAASTLFYDSELASVNGQHPIFSAPLGMFVSDQRMGAIDPDPTGYAITNDKDGDGIPDSQEVTTNKFVADYPRIVARIALPITMEVRVDQTNTSNNHIEIVEDNDVTQTINNSMESRHYTQFNLKTTPYVSEEAYSESGRSSEQYGYAEANSSFESESSSGSKSVSKSKSSSTSASGVVKGIPVSGSHKSKKSKTKSSSWANSKTKASSSSRSENRAVENEFARSSMSKKTVFEDVGYTDNLDRNGVEFKDETVERIAKNFRTSQALETAVEIGPNSGVVRASLYLKNTAVNIPVRVSNIRLTLSFRTPFGTFLPVKTFTFKTEDGVAYEQDVMGDEEVGPFAIEIDQLNTAEIQTALAKGYVPQVHVVSYDMRPVQDSNYTPGVTNLKIVEEISKGRTAQIFIRGKGINELYRVAAFDYDAQGNYAPGISLKKALFNILGDPLRSETWDIASSVTVADVDLSWRTGNEEHGFKEGINGNTWSDFETYIKTSVDEFNQSQKIETIKRIYDSTKYNPFNSDDNVEYDPSVRLADAQLTQMKYWMILHNGEYFEGDINDPIWVGDRYELVFVEIEDFNQRFERFDFTPMQSNDPILLNTRWNSLNNQDNLDRSVYLGKVLPGDVINLQVEMAETRHLFDPATPLADFGLPQSFPIEDGMAWYNFAYTLAPEEGEAEGIPEDFTHEVEGETNSFTVTASASKNSLNYLMTYCLTSNCAGTTKEVLVSTKDLAETSGVFTINRKTLDKNGVAVGEIAAGDYELSIQTQGKVSGVDVTTEGSSGKVSFTVTDAGGNFPGSFSYSLNGLVNEVEVRIDPSIYGEYYMIELYGPYNYGFTEGVDSPQTLFVPAGLTTITVNNPVAEPTNAGVYKVKAFAVNKNTLNAGVEDAGLIVAGSITSEFVTVEYDRYQSQRLLSPKKATQAQRISAVDLEVNFNDGTGWHRLAVSSDDKESGAQYLDVEDSSYSEQLEQRFHVAFQPSNNQTASLSSLFLGGRKEADVYLRTVAESKYRDTFWIKPPQVALTLNSVENAVYYNGDLTQVPNRNIVDHWVSLPNHDASRIEETLACNGYASTSLDLDGNAWFKEKECATDNKLALAHEAASDLKASYFFSPMEERTYFVTASIVPTIASSNNTALPEVPTFKTHIVGKGKLVLDDFSAPHASKFKVFYREGRAESVKPSESLASPWLTSSDITVTENGDPVFYSIGSNQDEYPALGLGKYYSFVVIAYNSLGQAGQRSAPFEVYFAPDDVPETALLFLNAID